jgi:glycosyltransferase involved in cell wall biosynthesis
LKNIKKSCIVIGPFPSPVTGLSIVNQFIAQKMNDYKINVIKYDTSPGSINRNRSYYFKKFKVVFGATLFLIKYKESKNTKLYLSVSGRHGKLSELIYVVIARIKKIPIILHHHSFLYIYKIQISAKLLFWSSGNKTHHISLSDKMGTLLKNKYSLKNKFITISNIVFYDLPQKPYKGSKMRIETLGFLSNISFEKGIDTFINLIESLHKLGIKISAKIVGPFEDGISKKYLIGKLKTNKRIKYSGPLYGKDKKQFYKEVDLFVLPTKNEAEPLVIYESLMNSIPVLSTEVGCIPEQIGNKINVGLIIKHKEKFIEESMDWILQREKSLLLYKESQLAALNRFIFLKHNSKNQLKKFISLFD